MCGIFGITNNPEASSIACTALQALQHRGQEGAGITSTDGVTHWSYRKKGLVSEVFAPDVLQHLQGTAAIGHTRYSTTGENITANLQPFSVKSSIGWLSIAHNGNLVNGNELTSLLESEGSIFQSTTDTEVIIHLIAKSKKQLPEALVDALLKVQGAYSLLVLNTKSLIAVRDPFGIRPLVLGEYNNCPVFASETSSFDLIGAKYVREVDPGEMIVVRLQDGTMDTFRPFPPTHRKRCVFEHVYFGRPDSVVYGANVYEVRKALGKRLAQEQAVAGADVVIAVPDSGNPAALGYAQELEVTYDIGLIRSHYIARTFIQPKQELRDLGVRLKLNAVVSTVKNKRVVVIDDSLVRGTTSKKIIKMIRDAGAREVHLRISSPPTTDCCFYGIATPNKEQLIGANHSISEICKFIEADSLGYLSVSGLNAVVSKYAGEGFCDACFTGNYPIQQINTSKLL